VRGEEARVRISPVILICILAAVLLGLSLVPENPLYAMNWPLFSVLILCLGIITFFRRFEKRGTTSKEIAVIASLASLAAIVRVPFAVIMSLQPTTFVVMISGYVFGPQTGFMVGAVAALVSNFFLGQGPWTPWQMFCWGMCGVAAGCMSGREKGYNRLSFAAFAGICGYLFGWVMNIWHWVGFIYPLTLQTFLATYLASFPFDTVHALGNIAFALLFGPPFYHILLRYRKKMEVRHVQYQSG
jgi:energy-coupling factor transport system substrate-specific component